MAHFAKLNDNNIVEQVIVVDNNNAETEQEGKDFIASIGLEGTWKQTSYNTYANSHSLGGVPFRRNYAGIGFSYDQERDAFVPPKPLLNPSFILNEETCLWETPLPCPEETEFIGWKWDEDTVSWETYDKFIE